MGFGGGAFGTGSYTYSVIDDNTIKLNQQKGVIYANQSALSPSTDNNTIYLNSSNQLAVKPSSITKQQSSLQNITISSNTTLTSDLYCNNLTINSGVILTTNGYNIYCSGIFTNNGTINTGYTPFHNFSNSYGGSGGGGGGNTLSSSYQGGNGYSTLVSGGIGGITQSGGNGSTPSTPTITNSLIQSWYVSGMSNFLAGAGGGNGAYSNAQGGAGAYGIYIQANQIIAGTINAIGQAGTNSSTSGAGGGGGGGGGVIVLSYGSGGYTAGTYNISGGSGGSSSYSGGLGGSGGAGQVLTYNYSTPPIQIGGFSYTSITGIKNRNSSYLYGSISTTSTSPTTIISQSFTPQTTGLVKVKAVVQVYNNTAGDGVAVSIYNGSNLLDTEQLISYSANQQQIAYLYNEVLYTAPFSQQAFSIQFNAVSGGTAYAEIQEFTIEEVY